MRFPLAPERALATAVQLDIFTIIAAGHTSAAAIARATRSDEHGVRALLEALESIELLERVDRQEYRLTRRTWRCLAGRDHPGLGCGAAADGGRQLREQLADAVGAGATVTARAAHDRPAGDPRGGRAHPVRTGHREPARRAAAALGLPPDRCLRVLDVACGSSAWGMEIARAAPHARITAQDRFSSLELARRHVRAEGLERRYCYLPGNVHRICFGDERFDLAILGGDAQIGGKEQAAGILRRLHRALRPGGRIAMVAPERSGTQGGAGAPYDAWLETAGFGRPREFALGAGTGLLVAERRSKT